MDRKSLRKKLKEFASEYSSCSIDECENCLDSWEDEFAVPSAPALTLEKKEVFKVLRTRFASINNMKTTHDYSEHCGCICCLQTNDICAKFATKAPDSSKPVPGSLMQPLKDHYHQTKAQSGDIQTGYL